MSARCPWFTPAHGVLTQKQYRLHIQDSSSWLSNSSSFTPVLRLQKMRTTSDAAGGESEMSRGLTLPGKTLFKICNTFLFEWR